MLRSETPPKASRNTTQVVENGFPQTDFASFLNSALKYFFMVYQGARVGARPEELS